MKHLPSNFVFKNDERYHSRVFNGNYKSGREVGNDVKGTIDYCLKYYQNVLEGGNCIKAHITKHDLKVTETFMFGINHQIEGDVEFILVHYR